MESMRITFKKKLEEKDEETDFLQHEIQKLKKKIGIKDDADIINLDNSEDGSISENEDISFANDEIEK